MAGAKTHKILNAIFDAIGTNSLNDIVDLGIGLTEDRKGAQKKTQNDAITILFHGNKVSINIAVRHESQ
jgi:hypothetical protein